MHYIGVVFPVTGAAHVCGKLIDLIKSAVDDGATKSLVPQVAHRKIVPIKYLDSSLD